jgi:hypothetical protein
MKNDDLISRATAIDAMKLAAYWNDAERKIAELPAVDAIPVEWLKEHCCKDIGTSDGYIYGRRRITVLEALSIWQKEQEAR